MGPCEMQAENHGLVTYTYVCVSNHSRTARGPAAGAFLLPVLVSEWI